MIRWVLAAAVAVGCKSPPSQKPPSRQALCADLVKGVADQWDAFEVGFGGHGTDPDPDRLFDRAAIEADCRERWSAEIIECVRKHDTTSAGCRRIPWLLDRITPSGYDAAPAGPTVASTVPLGEPLIEGYAVAGRADGLAIVIGGDGVLAFDASGARRWKREERVEWLITLPDDTLLAGGHELVALEPATGVERWRAAIPVAAGGDDEPFTLSGLVVDDHVFVLVDDGRILRVDPARCGAGPACVEVAFKLEDPGFGTRLVAGPPGTVVIRDRARLQVVDPAGVIVAALEARSRLGDVAALPTGNLAVTLDERLVILAPAACGRAPVMLPEGDATCPACVPPPAGCVVARARVTDVDVEAPAVLADGSVAVTLRGGSVARVGAAGDKRWESNVVLAGAVTVHGDLILGITDRELLDEPAPRLVAIDAATGKVRWATALSATRIPGIHDHHSRVAAVGDWLIALYPGGLSWLRLEP